MVFARKNGLSRFGLALCALLAIAGCQTGGSAVSSHAGDVLSDVGTVEPALSKAQKRRAQYEGLIRKHAKANGVPEKLALAVVEVESMYRPNARGKAGEVGLMQILPRTARYIGYTGSTKALFNPETNISYGMKYLGKAHQLGGGTTCGTILKYNAGHGAKRMNPVTRQYCNRVAQIMQRI